jgi:hypothetical protein
MPQPRWASPACPRIVAMEGERKNVRSNIIAPFAWTRMIASIPVKDEAGAQRVNRMKEGMRADQVAQLAVALCADKAKDVSGQIFGPTAQAIWAPISERGGWRHDMTCPRYRSGMGPRPLRGRGRRVWQVIHHTSHPILP